VIAFVLRTPGIASGLQSSFAQTHRLTIRAVDERETTSEIAEFPKIELPCQLKQPRPRAWRPTPEAWNL